MGTAAAAVGGRGFNAKARGRKAKGEDVPDKYVQYNYKDARDEWCPSVADSIWSKFKNTKTQARATLAEDERLKKEPKSKAASVRSVIDEIVNRSLGRGD